MSNALEIGQQLYDLCAQGQNVKAVDTLYADNVVSVEAVDMGNGRKAEGKAAIRGKNTWWMDNHEVHNATVKGPFPHGEDRFAMFFDYDITGKQDGQRRQMAEVGLYTVANGKIVREEFFYGR